ncbi:Uncharacterised protein [Bordetella pertussis]|nr:Uncharacterised protein [Bordetella pertussis]
MADRVDTVRASSGRARSTCSVFHNRRLVAACASGAPAA